MDGDDIEWLRRKLSEYQKTLEYYQVVLQRIALGSSREALIAEAAIERNFHPRLPVGTPPSARRISTLAR